MFEATFHTAILHFEVWKIGEKEWGFKSHDFSMLNRECSKKVIWGVQQIVLVVRIITTSMTIFIIFFTQFHSLERSSSGLILRRFQTQPKVDIMIKSRRIGLLPCV
jgi:hypothetical protein